MQLIYVEKQNSDHNYLEFFIENKRHLLAIDLNYKRRECLG